MDRQEGYYWVKHQNNLKHEISYWMGHYWTRTNYEYMFFDEDFEHINENRIKEPGELPD